MSQVVASSESVIPQTFFKRLSVVLDSIKIAHSIFALPFALIAMLVAADGWPELKQMLLIVVCMVTARSAAMGFNRVADRHLDAENPRTATRPTVTGAISPRFMILFVIVNVLLFWLATWFLNPVCFWLALPLLVILLGYSLAKRFTSLCHFWLGLALGMAPLGAHLAVKGHLHPLTGLGQHWSMSFEVFPILLGLAVLFWTAGFDLIYACQDFDVDSLDERLHSMPKSIGIYRTLVLSAILHVVAVLLLGAVGSYALMGGWYFSALACATGILIYEHLIVSPNDLSRVNVAFFTLNGAVSLILFAAVLIELL